jgi:hypothetical protein
MEPKSFSQWKSENADLLDELEETSNQCGYCDGRGDCQCDCGDLHDCRHCDGTGKKQRDLAKEMYEKYLDDDKKKMERWGREPIHA